jgi:hypothetical protein
LSGQPADNAKNSKPVNGPATTGDHFSRNVAAVKDDLLDLCRQQSTCIKESPESFWRWLRSQDIESLADLQEAMDDADFPAEMQSNGLKGFKKAAFKKAVQTAVSGSAGRAPPAFASAGGHQHQESKRVAEGLPELYCPISFALMTDDPVVASVSDSGVLICLNKLHGLAFAVRFRPHSRDANCPGPLHVRTHCDRGVVRSSR